VECQFHYVGALRHGLVHAGLEFGQRGRGLKIMERGDDGLALRVRFSHQRGQEFPGAQFDVHAVNVRQYGAEEFQARRFAFHPASAFGSETDRRQRGEVGERAKAGDDFGRLAAGEMVNAQLRHVQPVRLRVLERLRRHAVGKARRQRGRAFVEQKKQGIHADWRLLHVWVGCREREGILPRKKRFAPGARARWRDAVESGWPCEPGCRALCFSCPKALAAGKKQARNSGKARAQSIEKLSGIKAKV
jgi:hypothetical protein